MSTQDNTSLFISYSWKPDDHEEWVLELATALRQDGVDVILDKWDLKEGHDAHKFMERMVADKKVQKVAIISNSTYVEKANGREGGVGTETQIITPQIYQKQEQSKFVAIVSEHDENGNPYLPVYYQSRIYIDLSTPELYAKNYEQLLRWIYDKPVYIKPDLGKKPSFIEDNDAPKLETAVQFKRALDAIKFDRPNKWTTLQTYLELFSENLERFRISLSREETPEKIIENIKQFLPFRNEILETFFVIVQYTPEPEAWKTIHRFFEKLLTYTFRPEHINSYSSWDFENFKFIVHELFLYLQAILLKYEHFDAARYFLVNEYYVDNSGEENGMVSYDKIRPHLDSLESHGRKNRRLSFHADLLEQRAKTSGLNFSYIMQADFTLFLRDILAAVNNERYQTWWPYSLLYIRNKHKPFEIFARSQSKKYFQNITPLLGIKSKTDLDRLSEAIKEGKVKIPRWEFASFDLFSLIGYNKLSTKE